MRQEHGFTLIEVIVGIALLAAFLTGVYTVAIGSMQAKRRIHEMSAVFTAGPEILDLIERDIRGAYIHGVKDMKAMNAHRESVEGVESTYMDLVTTTNSKVALLDGDRVLRSDVTEVGYRLRGSSEFSGFLELYRREQFFFDDDPVKGGEYFLVYDRVRSLVIDFFEKPEAGTTSSSVEEEEGQEEWKSETEKALPFAVRITLMLGDPLVGKSQTPDTEREFKFVRWVLFPTAYDESPEEDEGPGGDGTGDGNGDGN